jgi:Kelch motif
MDKPGTWGPLNNQPTFGVGTMLLLTDGTVMAQNSNTPHWWKLAPDISGSYVNGTWSQLADGPNGPLYFASAVLRDGRVFVAGGEYNSSGGSDILAAEIYDPLTNAWTTLPTPAGWTNIGDASCCVFPDGRVFLGYIEGPQCAIYDPVANAWSAAANMLHGTTNEETWTLLQDQTIIVCDCAGHPATEKYLIASNQWITCGNTPTDLVEASSIEIGPALALPDGRVFAVGATGQTALYTMPPISSQPGSWAKGPAFPVVSGKQLGAKDAPGCLMPNGLVLCAVGPVDGVSGDYLSPTSFYEFDPTNNSLAATNDPPTNGGPPYVGRFLLLPTGQVLFASGTANLQVYTPTGAPDPMWKPNITSVPASVFRGSTYTLYGRQINGLSQAVSYGDDATMATNYPIVQIKNNATGHVFYARTSNHSTMAVNTGTVVHNSQFTVPASAELGASTITVIANGIASDPVAVDVIRIKLKEIKEVKLEKIEKIETKEKIEAIEKLLAKEHEIPTGGEVSGQSAANLAAVVRMLAERADQAELEKEQQRAFIQPEERPEVGAAAIDALPPPSKAKSSE